MKTIKHIGLFGALVAVALLAACSDKDDYTPGAEVPSGCQQVRFVESGVGVGGIVVAIFGVIDAYVGCQLKVFEERKVCIPLHAVSVAAVGRYVQQVVLQRGFV